MLLESPRQAPPALAPSHASLNKSVAHFARPSGPDLLGRTERFLAWQDGRREAGVYPFSRSIESAPDTTVTMRTEGGQLMTGLNFANTDYLGLATHPALAEAAARALRVYGPHSPSSPMLQGNTGLSLRLEEALGELLETEHVVLFPTGWAAGFGTISGLVRADDHIVMDNLAHACLQAGAQHATQKIRRHAHLDLDAVCKHLQEIRAEDTQNGILVISEGLFSMDSDYPDLARLQALCHEYEATLFVDVAHDLGAMGPGGTGLIGAQEMLGKIDLVMGAFSKSFGTNGGFLATHSRAVKHFVKWFGNPHIFSTAISPVQCAAALEAVRIVRSEEGEQRRERLMDNVCLLRSRLAGHGIACMGQPTPIIPVPVGSEKVGRVASALLFEAGVLSNLIEFPAVAVGAARFRMQVMATHTPEQLRVGADRTAEAIAGARAGLSGEPAVYAVVQGRG